MEEIPKDLLMGFKLEDLMRTKVGAAQLGVAKPVPAKPETDLKTRCIIAQTRDEEKLNKTEAAFYAALKADKSAAKIGVQSHTLKLADDTRYTPDFYVLKTDGRIVFYEVKGFWRDDAKVKIKIAARMYREYDFIVVMRSGNGFSETKVNP